MITSKSNKVTAELPEFSAVTDILAEQCIDCHNFDTQQGAVVLSRFPSLDDVDKDRELWKTLFDVVESGQMPLPQSGYELDDTQRETLLAFARHALSRLDPILQAIDPGKPVLRRLTRLEYNNTVRDLFDLDYDIFMFPERLPVADKRYFTENNQGNSTSNRDSAGLGMVVQTSMREYGQKYDVLLPQLGLPGDHRAEHGYANRGDALNFSPLRYAFIYTPNGYNQETFLPQSEGPSWELPPALSPLASLRDQVSLLSGLDREFVPGTGVHAQCGSCWLTSSAPQETLDGGFPTNTTLDQLLARQLGADTPLPSLELSCNDFTNRKETKYFECISWYGPGHAAQTEKNPRTAFGRLFGRPDGDVLNQSVLDGTLLDRCCIVMGSGISDGDKHNYADLQVLLAGGLVKHAGFKQYAGRRPLADLWLTLAQRANVSLNRFADSTGVISDV